MHLTGLLVLAIAFACLTGCSNALYFYETDKISLSLEGRPDSSQPVQGSLGLKQRVVVVAPPKDLDTMTKARSEPVSMISTFRFRKDKGGFADLGPVTIQTALVTGSAATNLKEKAPEVAAAQVIDVRTIGPDTPDIRARKKRLSECVNNMSDNTKREAIANLLIGDPSGTKTDIRARIRDLKLPEELEELEKSEKLCP